jgi:hypothetical protein
MSTVIRVFKLVPPTPHLRPQKIEEKKVPEEISPFVYTPFVTNREKVVKDASKAGINAIALNHIVIGRLNTNSFFFRLQLGGRRIV